LEGFVLLFKRIIKRGYQMKANRDEWEATCEASQIKIFATIGKVFNPYASFRNTPLIVVTEGAN